MWEMLASWAFQDRADLNDLSRVCMMPSGVPAKMLSDPGDTQLTFPCCFHQQAILANSVWAYTNIKGYRAVSIRQPDLRDIEKAESFPLRKSAFV